MRNRDLARDHLNRAKARLHALDVLYEAESWADVVRESQEVVELTLKALLRASLIEPPRVHDVSDVLRAHRAQLPTSLAPEIDALAAISRDLRRDRELAFEGAEDLTPSDFYSRENADSARNGARKTVELVTPHVTGPGPGFDGG
jgi:HEPN domain-containing protein